MYKWGEYEQLKQGKEQISFRCLFSTDSHLGLWSTRSSQIFKHFVVFMHTGCLTILMRKTGLHLETGEAGRLTRAGPEKGPCVRWR